MSGRTPSVIRVAARGAIAFAVTPYFAITCAVDSVICTIPALAAE
jgi:hypothetical protein